MASNAGTAITVMDLTIPEIQLLGVVATGFAGMVALIVPFLMDGIRRRNERKKVEEVRVGLLQSLYTELHIIQHFARATANIYKRNLQASGFDIRQNRLPPSPIMYESSLWNKYLHPAEVVLLNDIRANLFMHEVMQNRFKSNANSVARQKFLPKILGPLGNVDDRCETLKEHIAVLYPEKSLSEPDVGSNE